MLTAHCGRFGAGTHDQIGQKSNGSIKIVDNAAITTYQDAVGKVFVFVFTDGHGKTINLLLTSANIPASFSFSDEYENFSITFQVGVSAPETASKLLIAFNSAKAKFENTAGASTFAMDAAIDQSDSSKINFSATGYGFVGNTKLHVMQNDQTDQTKMVKVSSSHVQVVDFRNGKNPTSRIFRSQTQLLPQRGTISSENYSVISASFHKYHRNRADKFFLGDATQDNSFYDHMQQTASTLQYTDDVSSDADDLPTDILARGSVYDNAYIGHAIPRSDDQVRWVRSVNGLIQEQLNLEYDENDPIIEKIEFIEP
jgi:hypothetical protein